MEEINIYSTKMKVKLYRNNNKKIECFSKYKLFDNLICMHN